MSNTQDSTTKIQNHDLLAPKQAKHLYTWLCEADAALKHRNPNIKGTRLQMIASGTRGHIVVDYREGNVLASTIVDHVPTDALEKVLQALAF